MKLITLEDEFPVFNPEARMIKDFNAIIVRDKGSKGDIQARKKTIATKELAYIHFISYYNSEFVTSVAEEKRSDEIKKHLQLPEDWKPDALVEMACNTYKELVSTPTMGSLVEAREALFGAEKLLKIYRRLFDTAIQEMDSQITGLEPEEARKMQDKLLNTSREYYKEITDISKKMPENLDTIHKLEERVKKEMLAESRGKGKLGAVNLQELAD